jgi:hypothetical protein
VKKDYGKALEWFTKSANQGDGYSMNQIGQMYRDGKGGEKNGEKALEWYTKAADRGNVDSMTYLGAAYLEGKGLKQNLGKAVKYCEMAFNSGEIGIGMVLGMLNSIPSSDVQALTLGFKPQPEKAAGYFKAVIEDANQDPIISGICSYFLGAMYQEGRGVKRDAAIAKEWMKKATPALLAGIQKQKGLAIVKMPTELLAVIYGLSYSGLRNDSEAYKYLLIARQSGPLQGWIGNNYWQFSSDDKKKGQQLASQWLAKRDQKLTVTKLTLPNNNRNSSGSRSGGFLLDVLIGVGLGRALK